MSHRFVCVWCGRRTTSGWAIFAGVVVGLLLAWGAIAIQKPFDYEARCQRIAEQVFILEVLDGNDLGAAAHMVPCHPAD